MPDTIDTIDDWGVHRELVVINGQHRGHIEFEDGRMAFSVPPDVATRWQQNYDIDLDDKRERNDEIEERENT